MNPIARALLVGVALGAAFAARAESSLPGAVGPGVRGALALEPGTIRAGDTAVMEVVVATPPGHAVRPVTPPPELPGFWILGAEPLPVEKSDGRWIHRTRFTIRARELGQFAWPAQPVEIEAPDGSAQRLVIEGRPLEVVSVQARFPGRSAPFGYREPPSSAGGGPGGTRLGAAAAGFGAGLATAGALALALRIRRKRPDRVSHAEPPRSASPAPGALAREALAGAQRLAAFSPVAAANDAAAALRRYGGARFGRDLSAMTTPEIAARAVAPGEERAWRELAATLSDLDLARFDGDVSTAGARVGAAVARAAALVAEDAREDGR